MRKFEWTADLGHIFVPRTYNRSSYMDDFCYPHRGRFHALHPAFREANFPNPTRRIRPGERFRVTVYKQISEGVTTNEERMAFITQQGGVFLGAQGAVLVCDQKRMELPADLWLASFDHPEHLWLEERPWETSFKPVRRLPLAYCTEKGFLGLYLGDFVDGGSQRDAILHFAPTKRR